MSTTTIIARRSSRPTSSSAVAPLVVLPLLVIELTHDAPEWQRMWALAFSIFFGCKWLTAAPLTAANVSTSRLLAYLFLWPGMNARDFLVAARPGLRPGRREWLAAVVKLAIGLDLMFVVTPAVLPHHPIVAGWLGMTGLIFTLHFGSFHLLSLVWRRFGFAAPPIMRSPLLAMSLTDFWSKRWNLAFHELAVRYVFRPTVRTLGVASATMLVFVVSGLVHDLIITMPVRGGWGWPMMYFTLQGLAVLFERSRLGQRLRLTHGWRGRLWTAIIVLAPVGMLFPEPFVQRAILPTLHAIGAS